MSKTLLSSALVFAAAIAVVVVVTSGDGEDASAQPHWPQVHRAPVSAAKGKPNIVFIYSDDQNAAEFNHRYMPRTMRLLGSGGTTFSDFVVAAPICCPSRVGMLTGDYPHNSGVYMNRNGFPSLLAKANSLGSWMQRAGYHTAWFGKFLQAYKRVIPDATTPAPGFDDWAVSLRARYLSWKLHTEDGLIKGKHRPHSYYTDVLTRQAVRLARERLAQPRPLFMVVNHLAPHKGRGGKGRCAGAAAPAERDFGRFEEEPLPMGPAFNEADRSDKTVFPAAGDMGDRAIEADHDRYRCRVESLAAMDRGIAHLYNTIERAGELDNTIFVFTSDNGLLIGQHALDGKDIPYEEGIRMPLAMRVPKQVLGRSAVAKVDQLTANIDLTPTVLELAGAEPCVRKSACRTLDGRSLVPLLRGDDRAWPADRAIPIEGGIKGDVCGFRGLRLASEVMLEDVVPVDGGCKREGAPEYYDLKADPYQLDNLVVTDPAAAQARVDELQARLDRLESCSGIKGRDQAGPAGSCE
jgi:N-acetylglucosamine-6-sulfatase